MIYLLLKINNLYNIIYSYCAISIVFYGLFYINYANRAHKNDIFKNYTTDNQ